MANVNNPNGFTPVKHMNGTAYNGEVNEYYKAADLEEAFYVGDCLKLAGDMDETTKLPTVALASDSDNIVGVVVGFLTNYDHPTYVGYSPTLTGTTVLVCDDPQVIFEAQYTGTLTTGDIGANSKIVYAAGSTSTGRSASYVYGTPATTNTLQLQILRIAPKEDNEVGAYAKVWVRFNMHQYSVDTGGTGA
jgi:hypothetical protein